MLLWVSAKHLTRQQLLSVALSSILPFLPPRNTCRVFQGQNFRTAIRGVETRTTRILRTRTIPTQAILRQRMARMEASQGPPGKRVHKSTVPRSRANVRHTGRQRQRHIPKNIQKKIWRGWTMENRQLVQMDIQWSCITLIAHRTALWNQ